MKQLLSSCLLGLTLTLALAGCDRAEQAPAAQATPVDFQKVDTVTGTGKEATAVSTAGSQVVPPLVPMLNCGSSPSNRRGTWLRIEWAS